MDAAVIVAIVVGVVAVGAVVAAVLNVRRANRLDGELSASTRERERLERELDTLARIFAEQAEQLAQLQPLPEPLLQPIEPAAPESAEPALKDADELAEEVFDVPSGLLRERFVAVVLQQKVAASRRKITPLSVLAIELDRLRTASRAAIDDGMKVLGDVLRGDIARVGRRLPARRRPRHLRARGHRPARRVPRRRARACRVEDRQHRRADRVGRHQLLPGPRARRTRARHTRR